MRAHISSQLTIGDQSAEGKRATLDNSSVTWNGVEERLSKDMKLKQSIATSDAEFLGET